MNTDERPGSLASQAAAWIPPWERHRFPDHAYAAAVSEPDVSDDPELPAGIDESDRDQTDAENQPGPRDEPDPEQAAPDEPGESDGVPPELPAVPGEAHGPVTVDSPTPLPGEQDPDPTDVGVPLEVSVPGSFVVTDEPGDNDGVPVDAPVPVDGVGGSPSTATPVPDVAADTADASETDAVDSADLSQAAVDAADLPQVAVAAAVPDDPGRPSGSSDDATVSRSRRGGGRPVSHPRPVDVVAEADPPVMDDAELRGALEAILLVVDEPVGELQLAQIVEQPAERIARLLDEVSAAYTAAGHGFDLRRAAGGWRLYTRQEYAPYVERYVVDGQSVRLTQAALETLAVVAYKQPVSRSRISVIRGVNCDGVMRTLVTRGLVSECGTEPETGAILYRTTALFLEKLGLDSVDQLPPLAPFLPDDVEEVLDAQR